MSKPKPKLIITCDDFGMSPGVNEGVINAVKAGVITSVQVLINYPGAQDAVLDLAKAIRESGNRCGIGLHLCSTAGPSTLQKENGLVQRLGNQFFFTPFTQAEVGKHTKAMREELMNQYNMLVKVVGVDKIDSITSHHNIHYFSPAYFKILKDIAKLGVLPYPMRSPLTWNRDNWPKMNAFKDHKVMTNITRDAIHTGLAMSKETRKAVKAATSKKVLKQLRHDMYHKDKIMRPHTAYDFFYGCPSLPCLKHAVQEILSIKTRGWAYSTEIFTHLSANGNERIFENVTYSLKKRHEEYKVLMRAEARKYINSLYDLETLTFGSYHKTLYGRDLVY